MEIREEGCQTLLDPLLYCSWLCNKLFRYLKHNGKHTNVPFIWRFLQTEEIECNLDPATWGSVEKVAAHDVVRIFPGKSRGREHSLCAGLISIGTVAICREKRSKKHVYSLRFLKTTVWFASIMWYWTRCDIYSAKVKLHKKIFRI